MAACDNTNSTDNSTCTQSKACQVAKLLKGPVGMIVVANVIMLTPCVVSERWFSWLLYLCLAILALGFVAKKSNMTKALPAGLVQEAWCIDLAKCAAANANKFVTFSHEIIFWNDANMSMQCAVGLCGLVVLSWIFWPFQLCLLAVNGFLAYPLIMDKYGKEIHALVATVMEQAQPHMDKAKAEVEKLMAKHMPKTEGKGE